MKSVVTSVVTPKSGLTLRNHCENPYNGWKRVEFLPLYITNRGNREYSQTLTPVFQVTTEVSTVSDPNHKLGRHFCEKNKHTHLPGTARGSKFIKAGKGVVGRESPEKFQLFKNRSYVMKKKENRIEKLYSACTIYDEIDHRQEVCVHWFKVGPRWEDVDYSQLIEDYDALDETEKDKAEEIVNEYFTKKEIRILRRFFKKKLGFQEGHLQVNEHSIPIRVKLPENGEMFASLQEVSYKHNTLEPKHQDGLPFEVWGYYNMDLHFPADQLSEDHIWDGTEFLKEALAIIFPDSCEEGYNPEDLDDVVSELYEKHGLFVGLNNVKRWSSREKEA